MLTRLLRELGADGAVLSELSAYCANPYRRRARLPELPLGDEPHVAIWREYAVEAAASGAVPVLRARFPQFRFPVRSGISAEPGFRAASGRGEPAIVDGEALAFADEPAISIAVHETPAGAVPVIVAGERGDFESLVRVFSESNEPVPVPGAMGACLIGGLHNWDRVARHRAAWGAALEPAAAAARWPEEYGRLGQDKARYQDRVLLLSSGPYSAVPAAAAGRGEEEWLRDSLRIRLGHECFHYLTVRLFGVLRSNLLDELLADAAGLLEAFEHYRADLALRFLGIEQDGSLAADARLRVYRGSLSEEALAVLARLAVVVAGRLETLANGLPAADARARAERLVAWAAWGLEGLAAGDPAAIDAGAVTHLAAATPERAGLEPLGPEVATLAAALAERAGTAPDALAFATEQREISYGRLQAESDALAGGLASLGIGRGDRVVLFLPGGGIEFVLAFFALQRLGAAPCAFDPQAPATTSVQRARRLRPALLLGSAGAGALAAAAAAAGLAWAAFEGLPRRPPPPWPAVGAADIAFLQPTSGTSGEPRAVLSSQHNALASLRAARTALAAGAHDTLVSWVPPWHDLGLLRFILAPVFLGAPCHLVEPAIRTLPTWLRTASRVGATILGAPDFAYRLAVRLVEPTGIDLGTLRIATNGGETVRLSTILAFEERFGAPGAVRPGYGLAEATLGVACARPGAALRVDGRGNVSCGPPFPGVEVRILRDQHGQRDGAAGQILVRGATVFEGYFEAPEATREVLRDGWLHTGDSGSLDADGHLTVLGRERSMLKRGGEALAPRELEEAAESAREVRLAAAVAVPPGPDAVTERTVLAIEADRAAAPAAAAAAAAAAVQAALGFAPDRVLVLAARALPRTPNGKIRHRELRDGIMDGSLARRGEIVFSAGAAL